MKKLAFVFTFGISMMLFSCGSESNETATSEVIHPKKEQIVAQKDSLNKEFEKTSKAINLRIQSLNKAEVDLVREFDLK